MDLIRSLRFVKNPYEKLYFQDTKNNKYYEIIRGQLPTLKERLIALKIIDSLEQLEEIDSLTLSILKDCSEEQIKFETEIPDTTHIND
ncbi:MAG: hypothetical protein ACRC4M_04705 [Mycoplasma sp.]